MAYHIRVKEKAIKMRKDGYSLNEICNKIGIAKSTTSLWLRNIDISKKGLTRLERKKKLNGYNTALRWRRRRKEVKEIYERQAVKYVSSTKLNSNHKKLICAILFWAEGAKRTNTVKFMNSDPKMIQTFLKLFRGCFDLKEEKLRITIHLHEYHNVNQSIHTWSRWTKIPPKQFQKPYIKPHTGKRKRPNYCGCVSINYSDASIARELEALYNAFARKII